MCLIRGQHITSVNVDWALRCQRPGYEAGGVVVLKWADRPTPCTRGLHNTFYRSARVDASEVDLTWNFDL
jgi:hypothetical protein